jgi:hypothetical protein
MLLDHTYGWASTPAIVRSNSSRSCKILSENEEDHTVCDYEQQSADNRQRLVEIVLFEVVDGRTCNTKKERTCMCARRRICSRSCW